MVQWEAKLAIVIFSDFDVLVLAVSAEKVATLYES